MRISIARSFIIMAAAAASSLWAQSPVSDLSDAKGAVGVLAAGAQRTTEVALKFKEVPKELAGKTLVAAARGDRAKAGAGYQFTVTKNATVYLFVMDRGKPTAPAGWKKTDLKSTFFFDASGVFQDVIYSKDFTAGEKVVVPAHDGTDGNTFGVPNCCVVAPKE